jgi:hypothetical protein
VRPRPCHCAAQRTNTNKNGLGCRHSAADTRTRVPQLMGIEAPIVNPWCSSTFRIAIDAA